MPEYRVAGAVNGWHVGVIGQFNQVGLGGKLQHLGHQGLIQLSVENQLAIGFDQSGFNFRIVRRANQRLDDIHSQSLARIPAIESIRIVAHQEEQLFATPGVANPNRCGEMP